MTTHSKTIFSTVGTGPVPPSSPGSPRILPAGWRGAPFRRATHPGSICLIFLITIFISLPTLAQAPWRENKLRQQKKWEVVEEKINQIPIYREKLSGDYQMLAPVRGEDALTKKKDAVIRHMRIEAYKMKADAIMEFKCRRLKAIYQSCEGIAIRYKNRSDATNEPKISQP